MSKLSSGTLLSNSAAPVINEELYNQLKQLVQDVISSTRTWSYARVEEYDRDTHSVRVTLLPETANSDVNGITGFIPLETPWMGSGWGMQCAPKARECFVWVLMIHGVLGPAVAFGPFFNTTNLAPHSEVPIEDGEWLLRHMSGSYIHMKNNSAIFMKHEDGTEIEVDPDSNVYVRAPGKIVDVKCNEAIVNADTSVDVTTQTATVDATTVDVTATGSATIASPNVMIGEGNIIPLLNAVALATFNSHVHLYDSGQTFPPTQPMIPGTDTTVATIAG